MNDMARAYLGRIEQSLEDLQELLKDAEGQTQGQQEAHERLLKQFWSQGKELAALAQSIRDFEKVQDENKQLKDTHKELEERTRRVLEHVKTLIEEFRR